MSTLQKVIKYLVLAFALFLIVSVSEGIISTFYGLAKGFYWDDGDKATEMSATSFDDDSAKKLVIDIHAAQLEIKTGDELKAETNNEDITIQQKSDVLQIKERSHNWFENTSHSKVVVYVPEDMQFDEIQIATGAGEVTIDSLVTDVLELNLGAGEVKIDNLEVKESADIDGGAGEMTIFSGSIANLDFDMGVGEADIKTKLFGECDIDMGIGELTLGIKGEKSDYAITIDKGIGDYTVDGEKVHDGETIGDGNNSLQIDGGIGEAEIQFIK